MTNELAEVFNLKNEAEEKQLWDTIGASVNDIFEFVNIVTNPLYESKKEKQDKLLQYALTESIECYATMKKYFDRLDEGCTSASAISVPAGKVSNKPIRRKSVEEGIFSKKKEEKVEPKVILRNGNWSVIEDDGKVYISDGFIMYDDAKKCEKVAPKNILEKFLSLQANPIYEAQIIDFEDNGNFTVKDEELSQKAVEKSKNKGVSKEDIKNRLEQNKAWDKKFAKSPIEKKGWSAINEDVDVRPVTNQLLELLDQGIIDAEQLSKDLMGYMSEDDVADFANYHDIFDVDDIDSKYDVRKATNKMHELFDEGSLDADYIARNLLLYLSEDDVADFARTNDYLLDDEDEEISDDEEITEEDKINEVQGWCWDLLDKRPNNKFQDCTYEDADKIVQQYEKEGGTFSRIGEFVYIDNEELLTKIAQKILNDLDESVKKSRNKGISKDELSEEKEYPGLGLYASFNDMPSSFWKQEFERVSNSKDFDRDFVEYCRHKYEQALKKEKKNIKECEVYEGSMNYRMANIALNAGVPFNFDINGHKCAYGTNDRFGVLFVDGIQAKADNDVAMMETLKAIDKGEDISTLLEDVGFIDTPDIDNQTDVNDTPNPAEDEKKIEELKPAVGNDSKKVSFIDKNKNSTDTDIETDATLVGIDDTTDVKKAIVKDKNQKLKMVSLDKVSLQEGEEIASEEKIEEPVAVEEKLSKLEEEEQVVYDLIKSKGEIISDDLDILERLVADSLYKNGYIKIRLDKTGKTVDTLSPADKDIYDMSVIDLDKELDIRDINMLEKMGMIKKIFYI